jgi:hypothetical protein
VLTQAAPAPVVDVPEVLFAEEVPESPAVVLDSLDDPLLAAVDEPFLLSERESVR